MVTMANHHVWCPNLRTLKLCVSLEFTPHIYYIYLWLALGLIRSLEAGARILGHLSGPLTTPHFQDVGSLLAVFK
jgi:hypothetical protein